MVDLLTSGAAANPRSDSNPLCSNSPASACMENPNSIPNMNSPQTPLSKYGSDPTTLRSSSANGNSSLSLINTAHEMDRDDKIIFSPGENYKLIFSTIVTAKLSVQNSQGPILSQNRKTFTSLKKWLQ